MTATSRIVSVRCGSDGPFDAGSVRRTTDNAPCYASLPTSVRAARRAGHGVNCWEEGSATLAEGVA